MKKLTIEELESQVKQCLTSFILVPQIPTLNLTDRFQEDLGLDSLDCVEYYIFLEDKLGLEIPDEYQQGKFHTLQDVVNYLKPILVDSKEYQMQVTEKNYGTLALSTARIFNQAVVLPAMIMNLNHSLFGLADEFVELVSWASKAGNTSIQEGSPEWTNLIEELGDVLWYVNLGLWALHLRDSDKHNFPIEITNSFSHKTMSVQQFPVGESNTHKVIYCVHPDISDEQHKAVNISELFQSFLNFIKRSPPELRESPRKTVTGAIHVVIYNMSDPVSVLTAVSKKTLIYRKEISKEDLDSIKVAFEKIVYYLQVVAELANIPFERVLQANINKLAARYKEGVFNPIEAANRDFEAESKALNSTTAAQALIGD